MWPLNTPGITSSCKSGEPNFTTERATMAVVPQVTHGTCARRFSSSQMRRRTRRAVEWLGRYGGIARGIVFLTSGIFLVIAAVDAQPQQAKGIDSSLRALAATPLGPWLLVLVAIGLIMFGLFSCCQAKWMRL